MMKTAIFLFLLLSCTSIIAQQVNPYQKGEEGTIHIWISEAGTDWVGIHFLAYDFDLMQPRGINTGFQGTYKTIEIGEHIYTTENLKAMHQSRWGNDRTWMDWNNSNIAAITRSYDPRADETPLRPIEFQKYYGNWFSLLDGARSYKELSMCQFRDRADGVIQSGWRLPGIEDITQLIGQAPRNSESVINDILDFVADGDQHAPNGHMTEWSSFSNISGLSLTPLGSREPIEGNMGTYFYAHKKLSKLRLKDGSQTFTFYQHETSFSPNDYHYTQIRYCKIKTDEELGYKMYVNNCTDEVIILYLDEETEFPELPRGLERGIALKYANISAQMVNRKWSEIQEEATEYRNAILGLPSAPALVFPECDNEEMNISITPDAYKKGEEGTVHIWISETGTDWVGIHFLAYDFDLMQPRGINTGFQGTYKTIEIGEYIYTTENLKAMHQSRWGNDRTWMDWNNSNIAAITRSYDPRADETPLSPIEFQKYYGNWFSLLDGARSYREPTMCQFKDNVDGNIINGWGLPSVDDIYQIAGQAPRLGTNINYDLTDFVADGDQHAPNGHMTEWSSFSNTSGLSLTPLGSREPIEGNMGTYFYAHKKLSKLRLKDTSQTFTFYHTGSSFSSNDYHYTQIRYCRPKTDKELGYKMYIDETNNRVVMLPHEANVSLPELPKGLERGVALRYTNRQYMRVLLKWTDIQKEADAIRKSLNGEFTPIPTFEIDDDYFDNDGNDEDEVSDGGDDGGSDDKEVINVLTYAYDLSGNRVKKEILLLQTPELRNNETEPEIPSVYEIIQEQKITIYPNPTLGELMVKISDFSKDNIYSVTISDMKGRRIVSQKITDAQTYLNIQQHPAGIYIMKLIINGKNSTWKIIKE